MRQQPFYANELARAGGAAVKDYGILESPYPPSIGMDRMVARTRTGRYLVECASGSTLHGFNHLVAPRRHSCERFLIATLILAALGGLIGVSLDSWQRYQHESTVLVLDNNFRKFEIAKPAVTICPVNLLDESKFPEVFARYNVTDTPKIRLFFLRLSSLTYGNIRSSLSGFVDDEETSNGVAPELWLRLLFELRGQVRIVSQYSDEYTWISTERGLCMMFASDVAQHAAVESWLYNNGVPETAKISNQKRSFFNVKNYGVVGSISCKTHDFWMTMHYPATIPDYSTPGKLVRKVTLNSLTLSIVEVASSVRVRRLAVRQRGCKLHEDGGLTMWPVYTSNMCRLECRYRAIRELCGCVPHFAPPTKDSPTCTVRQLLCISEHVDDLISLRSDQLKVCGCLQDCDEALYIDKESTSFALKEGSPSDAIMNLNIDFPRVKYIREELFGFVDFLASVGGAGGLFLGASVLSVCEIVYFATLRLLWYYVEEKRKAKKIRQLIMGKK